ncbi:thioredoxin domain-containing protein [Azoarcus sp. KH32C]|uniref:DsbA family protein n=1 Tax=Azoarcus sp. KH32C TaxID=748247 RepID=UPI000238673B|nr:thioredoxin domain-containing protein [Azoarcus sp. KH32C]BAL24748.1 putative protein disulfide-isomerase [Azoarcus sp. KH32C]
MNQKYLFGIVAAMMVVAFIAAAMFHGSGKGGGKASQPVANAAALVREQAPSLGASDARVHIVEFFDPACETCREFYPFVKKLMAAAPARVRLTMRYAPFHDGSDQLVRMLEAARLQGKFWETLEAMYGSQANWTDGHRARPEVAWNYIGGVGLDIEKLKADMSSAPVEAAIRQDMHDAQMLNVTMTPEFFVNGRPMPSFGYDQLKGLVAEELKAAY